jgi:mycoredoxin
MTAPSWQPGPTGPRAAGIEFEDVDLEQDHEATAFVTRVNEGNQTVPTLRFGDGSTLTNPSLAQVKSRLAALAGS